MHGKQQKYDKNRAQGETKMYRKTDKEQITFVDDFFLPFGAKLRKDNR